MRRWLTVTGPVAVAVAMACATPAAAAARVVHYRGLAVSVPGHWPVIRLGADPRQCVRFDRAAVYLGRPSPDQRCAAAAVAGRPRAILVEPRGRGAVVIRRAAQTVAVGASPARPHIRGRAAQSSFSGLGFDACSAPSANAMSAWASSPFRAVGVYIGGANMACSQPNLTAPWVQAETAAGWHLILTYVGLQAPGNSCGCAAINSGQAAAQGRAAATDAVSLASSLGIGPGNPIYFDMEAYPRTSAVSSVVLSFLAAWTNRLHADGYQSGVYSSSGSGISDLASRYGTSYPEPDDIWFAEWNGSQSTDSAYIPTSVWAGHHRLHQYEGDHNDTYGGVTLNIDSDAVDGDTATAGQSNGVIPDGTFIQQSATGQFFRIAGGAPLYVSDWSGFGGPQPYTQVGPQQFAALDAVPVDGTFLETTTGALSRVAGGYPFAIADPSLFPSAAPVQIDPWDLANLGNPLAHLSSTPADGTVVQGLPSGSYWSFSHGRRRRVARVPAIQVPDAALAQFPLGPCLVPRLIRLTLPAVRAALGQTDCRLGRVVRRRRPRRGHPLHVRRQFPGPRASRPAQTRVAVTLG